MIGELNFGKVTEPKISELPVSISVYFGSKSVIFVSQSLPSHFLLHMFIYNLSNNDSLDWINFREKKNSICMFFEYKPNPSIVSGQSFSHICPLFIYLYLFC